MSRAAREAYDAGKLARHNGKPASANPHPLGTTLSRAWSKGWNTQ
jgi:hypothetical protein